MTIAIITEDGVRKVAPLVLDAKAQADLAAAFAVQAQLAAGIATAIAAERYYASYAAGNAATTAGQYFAVLGSGVYDFYLNGTATPVVSMPVLNSSGYFAAKLGVGVAPVTWLHVKASGEISRIETTAARGTGQCYRSFFDPTGEKGYIGYAGGADDIFRIMNVMNAGFLFGTNGVNRWELNALGHWSPMLDNTYNLGTAGSGRVKDIYLVNSPTVTSDEREKDWRGGLSEAELRAAKRITAELGFYQWKTEVATMGEDAPLRFGAKAQAVRAILDDEGLLDGNPARYGLIDHHEWTDEETGDLRDRYSVCPDQLALFLIAGQEARLAALEAAL